MILNVTRHGSNSAALPLENSCPASCSRF